MTHLGITPLTVEILGDHAFWNELLEKCETQGLVGGAGGCTVPSERLVEDGEGGRGEGRGGRREGGGEEGGRGGGQKVVRGSVSR